MRRLRIVFDDDEPKEVSITTSPSPEPSFDPSEETPLWNALPPHILEERQRELEAMLQQISQMEPLPPTSTGTSKDWVCAHCGYSFDPAQTRGDFRCPRCGAGGPMTISMFWVPE